MPLYPLNMPHEEYQGAAAADKPTAIGHRKVDGQRHVECQTV